MNRLFALVLIACLAGSARAIGAQEETTVPSHAPALAALERPRPVDVQSRLLAVERLVGIPQPAQRRSSRDTLKNGAIIGAAVMGALVLAACTNLSAGECARVAPFEIALGALIGTGIDALNGGRSVIYSRPAAVSAPGATAGLRFKLRF